MPNNLQGMTIGSGFAGWGQGQTYNPFQFDPNAANINTGQSDQDRLQQQQLAKMLLDQAQGGGPANQIVGQQLQNATDANVRQAMALGQSMPGNGGGGNLAIARNILDNAARSQQTAAGQGAELRGQLQLAGQQQLGQELGGMRGQDIGLSEAQTQANLENQGQQANYNLGFQGLENNAIQGQASNTTGIEKGLIGGASGGLSGAAGLGSSGGGAAGGAAGMGGDLAAPVLMSPGGWVPGHHPYNHDTTSQDVVKALLTPHEIVLPLSVTESADPPARAAEFVERVQKKADGGEVGPDDFARALRGKKSGFKRMVRGHQNHEKRLAKLEKLVEAMR